MDSSQESRGQLFFKIKQKKRAQQRVRKKTRSEAWGVNKRRGCDPFLEGAVRGHSFMSRKSSQDGKSGAKMGRAGRGE